MQKQLLERFITKYNLGGSAESVIIVSKDNEGIKTKFMTDDKLALGVISTPNIQIEEGEYGVFDTTQLRSILSVLQDEIKIKVAKNNSKPTGFAFSDGTVKATYVLAEKSNIPATPNLMKTPEFELIIDIDQQFLNTFIRAKSALPTVETFTVLTDGTKVEVILGYNEQVNTNRISLTAHASKNEQIDPISFSSKYFRDMLIANKEMKSGKLSISSKGLSHISFDVDDFSVEYYLPMTTKKE